jgi:hypothetical protein
MRTLVLVAALLLAACKAGDGVGKALGPLFIEQCKDNEDFGRRNDLKIFDLQPAFFAAEPIEEGEFVKIERLVIRLQPTGRSRELNDALTFDIPDSREVARCVRGALVNGQPEYDPKNCVQGPNGPRLRIAPDALVRSSLAPYSTCRREVVAVATSDAGSPDNWASWIDLSQFGTAVQAGAPQSRQPVPPDFKVDINEPLQSPAFFLTLHDQAWLNGGRSLEAIFGRLEGNFDFVLQRGQGAQTFP